MWSYCSKSTAVLMESTLLYFCRNFTELNFIEQCWGWAKGVYRTYPPSLHEDDLEVNILRSLDSVPLQMMRKFMTCSRRVMDEYNRGLNGKQAAWAARKYWGRRLLPPNIFEELEKEGVT